MITRTMFVLAPPTSLISPLTSPFLSLQGGVSPLHIAARTARVDMVEELLQANANADLRDQVPALIPSLFFPLIRCSPTSQDGHSPLHHAAYNGYLEVVERLLQIKASVNEKTLVCGCPYLSPPVSLHFLSTSHLLLSNVAGWHDANPPRIF